MKLLLIFLSKHPELGMNASFGAALIAFMNESLPFIQYGGAILGILIGLLTLIGLIKKTFSKDGTSN